MADKELVYFSKFRIFAGFWWSDDQIMIFLFSSSKIWYTVGWGYYGTPNSHNLYELKNDAIFSQSGDDCPLILWPVISHPAVSKNKEAMLNWFFLRPL